MSYCRFSHRSDVYAYESNNGFVIHVASGKTYTFETEEEMYEMLRTLKEDGISVPDTALRGEYE